MSFCNSQFIEIYLEHFQYLRYSPIPYFTCIFFNIDVSTTWRNGDPEGQYGSHPAWRPLLVQTARKKKSWSLRSMFSSHLLSISRIYRCSVAILEEASIGV